MNSITLNLTLVKSFMTFFMSIGVISYDTYTGHQLWHLSKIKKYQ